MICIKIVPSLIDCTISNTLVTLLHYSHALITQCAHPRVRVRVVEAVLFTDTVGAGRAQCSSVEYPAKLRATPGTVATRPRRSMFDRLLCNTVPQRPVNYYQQRNNREK